MADIQQVFSAQLVDHTGKGTLTDGSVLWEVVTPEGERVASCTNAEAANKLEMALNMALTAWLEEDEADRTVEAL